MSLSASLVLPRLVSSTDRRGLSARICSFTERGKNGASGWSRTTNQSLKRGVLCQLSYKCKMVNPIGVEPITLRLKVGSSAN